MFRVCLITFAITFAFLLLISFYSGSILYDNSYNDTRNYSSQLFEQISINVSNSIGSINNIATVAARHPDVLGFVFATTPRDSNLTQYYEMIDSIRAFLNNLCVAQDNIERVFVLSTNHEYYASTSSSPFVVSFEFAQQEWYQQALRSSGQPILVPSHIPEYVVGQSKPVISYVFPISLIDGLDPVGMIVVDIQANTFDAICNEVSLGDSGYSYIINSKGEAIYHPLADQTNPIAIPASDRVYTPDILFGRTSFTQVNGFNIENLVMSKSLPDTDWYAVGVVPTAQLNAAASELRNTQIFVGTLVAAIVSVLLTLFLNAHVFQRLFRLQHHMADIRQGNLNAAFDVGAPDEIGELGDGFNRMTTQIKQLIADVSIKEDQKRQAEFAALQAQINPHFLYNTLDSIVWMAETNPVGASEMAYRLASFFRLSLSRGADIVPLSQELEHIKTYLQIQKIRYESYFDFEIHVAQDVAMFPVPKLIVQPLVENAIYHGIKPAGRKCTLSVHAFRYHHFVLIEVSDDGVGIAPEQIPRILRGETPPDNRMSGVGVKNVDERVKLYYPMHSGLFFRSHEGFGTLSCIYIYDQT